MKARREPDFSMRTRLAEICTGLPRSEDKLLIQAEDPLFFLASYFILFSHNWVFIYLELTH